mmetsp:Transcript_4084/g.11640  ORF Transcript_4084/g.11640 Transcript_4084/m.11640 type:complete len:256 (-) Transcript_4084:229-996(-)
MLEPPQRRVHGWHARLRAGVAERVDAVQLALGEVALAVHGVALAEAGVVVQTFVVLSRARARQQAAAERVVGVEPHAQRAQARQQLALHVARDPVVHALIHGRLHEAVRGAEVVDVADLPGGVVRKPELLDLARLVQPVHRLERLEDLRRRVRVVQVVDVDGRVAERLRGRRELARDARGREHLVVAVERVRLRRDAHGVAEVRALAEDRPQHRLGAALVVHPSRIYFGVARADEVGELRRRVGLVRLAAKGHGA